MLGCWLILHSFFLQAIASVDREEMFVEHMKERERRKRAEEKAARKRKLQDFRELLERSSGIKVCSSCHHDAVYFQQLQLSPSCCVFPPIAAVAVMLCIFSNCTHLASIPGENVCAMFRFCHAHIELPCSVLSSGCNECRTVRFV